MIKVILTDDHSLVRMGFKMLIQNDPEITVIAEADSGEAVCQLIIDQDIDCDVVVMDITMPGISGIEATKKILAKKPHCRILALSAHEDSSMVKNMLLAGARAYLSKRSAPDSLIQAIKFVASDLPYIDQHLKSVLKTNDRDDPENPVCLLSEKEFEVFIYLAKGRTVNEVANLLNVSPRTTGTHLYSIKQKLKVGTQSELTLIAIKHNLIEP